LGVCRKASGRRPAQRKPAERRECGAQALCIWRFLGKRSGSLDFADTLQREGLAMRQKHPTGQKRRAGRAGPRVTRRALLLGAGAAALGAAGLWLRRLGGPGGEAPAAPDAGAPPAGEWRAAWISYIELQGMDYTSAEAFRAGAAAMMDRCAGLGLNTVIVQ